MATEKRLIDADEIQYRENTVCHGHGLYLTERTVSAETIAKMPTVDAVEVVRCKDCKNRDEITGECQHPKAVGWDVIIPEDDDFCSYGERKDDA